MVHIESLLQTVSIYANRWGGPRFRSMELFKLLNKVLHNNQIEAIKTGAPVNMGLSSVALLSCSHSPLYPSKIVYTGDKMMYSIEDELGFKGMFAEGTQVYCYEHGQYCWKRIEEIRPGTMRIINLESRENINNTGIHHHHKSSSDMYTMDCGSEQQAQKILGEEISTLMIFRINKDNKKEVIRVREFDKKNNSQELIFVEITKVEKFKELPSLEFVMNSFSHVLFKDKKNSDSSGDYRKLMNKQRPKKYLNMLREKVFVLKKDVVPFEMELSKIEND
jgi:hypothetical protein